ncbi:hypothetical protein CBR_g29914 [Chara braunii]|uniref:BRCT domain-containing protein n=1 Tax=Chara braunii TaxID=69332 RepID=A0A388JWZ9_CHABU|nr:hypothetical protein CBR_g29914 [Chara braunii]|eukprot:GBG62305.1 hypothetical protein CBR_g29914 [Chara braunii]
MRDERSWDWFRSELSWQIGSGDGVVMEWKQRGAKRGAEVVRSELVDHEMGWDQIKSGADWRSEKNPPPVVRPEWVTDSIAAGKLLPYGSYQLQRLLFAHPGQRTLTESIIPRTPLGSGWPRVEEVGHSEQPQAVGSSWEACPSSTADTGLTGAAASDGRPPSSSVIMTGMQNDPLCHSVAAACSIPDEVQAKQDAARMVDLSVLEGHLLAMKPPQLQTGLQNGRLSVDGPLTSISSVQDKLSVPSSVHDGPRQLTAACGSSPDDSAIRSLFPNGSTTTAVRGQPGTMATHSSLQMSHGEKLEKVVGEIWPTPSCPQRSAEQSLNGWNRYKDGERVTVCDDARHFPRQGTADMCRLVEQSVPLGSSDSSSRGLLIEKPAEMLDGWHGGAVSVPSGMSEAEQPLGCAAANGKGPLLKEAEQGLFDSRTVLMGAGENSCAIGHVDGRTMFGEDVQRNDKGAVRAGEERGNGGGSDDLIGNQEEETKGAIGSTGGTGTAAGQRGPPLVPPEPSVQRSSGKIPDPKTSHSTQSDPNFIQNYYKNSRLHFIGTWRNRYREPTEREENGEEKPANQKAGVERGPEPMAPARAGQISGHIDGRVIIHVDMAKREKRTSNESL